MSSYPDKSPSTPFEEDLRQAAEQLHPRPTFVAELRASLADQQALRAAGQMRFPWARPLVLQGGLLALLVGLVLLALFLAPQIAPDVRPGQGIEYTATPLPDQPLLTGPDALPTGALARLGKGQILAMDTAADGRLAVGSSLGICIYNTGHTPDWCVPFGLAYNIAWVLFNPSGDHLAVALSETDGTGKIVVLDASNGGAVAAHPFPNWQTVLSFNDAAVAWDPSGLPRLAIPGESGHVLVWDWQSDIVVWGPLNIQEAVSGDQPFSLDWALDPQGKSVLAAGGRNGLALLDGSNGLEILRLSPTWQAAPVGNITALDLSPDGHWLAYSYDNGVVALRIEGGQVADRKVWETHWQPMQLAIGPQAMGLPLAYQTKEGVQVTPLEGDYIAQSFPASYGPLAWDAQGALYFARADGMLGVYQNGQDTILPGDYSVWPERIAWNAAGELLSLHGRAIAHWDTASTKLGAVGSVTTNNPMLLAVSADGARAAYYQEGEAAISIWDTASNQAITRLAPAYRSSLAAFSADGASLVTIGPNGQLSVWDTTSGQAVRSQMIREMNAAPLNSQLDGLAVTPNGRTAALAWVRDNTLHLDLWDLERGAKLHELPVTSSVTAMAWSPDGRTLAEARSGYITLWDAASGQQVQSMGPEMLNTASDAIYPVTGWITAIAWAPDGKTIATGGGLVTLWDAAQGLPLRGFGGHRGRVSDVAFRSDGLVLASSSTDGTILLWDLGMGGGLPPVEQQPTATPLSARPYEPTATPLPVEPTATSLPLEPSPMPLEPLTTPRPGLSEQGLAGNVLWSYLTALSSGADNPNEYQQAAILYGGSWEALMQVNPDIPGNNLPALLQRACEVNGYHCGSFKQFQTRGERDGYLFEVDYSDGTRASFRVAKNASGAFKVMDLPPKKD